MAFPGTSLSSPRSLPHRPLLPVPFQDLLASERKERPLTASLHFPPQPPSSLLLSLRPGGPEPTARKRRDLTGTQFPRPSAQARARSPASGGARASSRLAGAGPRTSPTRRRGAHGRAPRAARSSPASPVWRSGRPPGGSVLVQKREGERLVKTGRPRDGPEGAHAPCYLADL